jgi:hypothetical protein
LREGFGGLQLWTRACGWVSNCGFVWAFSGKGTACLSWFILFRIRAEMRFELPFFGDIGVVVLCSELVCGASDSQ